MRGARPSRAPVRRPAAPPTALGSSLPLAPQLRRLRVLPLILLRREQRAKEPVEEHGVVAVVELVEGVVDGVVARPQDLRGQSGSGARPRRVSAMLLVGASAGSSCTGLGSLQHPHKHELRISKRTGQTFMWILSWMETGAGGDKWGEVSKREGKPCTQRKCTLTPAVPRRAGAPAWRALTGPHARGKQQQLVGEEVHGHKEQEHRVGDGLKGGNPSRGMVELPLSSGDLYPALLLCSASAAGQPCCNPPLQNAAQRNTPG